MKKAKQQNAGFLWHCLLVFVLVAVAGVVALNAYSLSQLKKLSNAGLQEQNQMMHTMGRPMSRMSFSAFDEEKATEFMDKDDDGMCDACGMEITQCIASGMMQCTMDPEAQIGVLGTQHIHADWKIYINGKPFDWTPFADRHQKQMMGDTSIKDTSAFIHIHPAQAPEKAVDAIHMHATGVPLSLFFESLGIKLSKDCFEVNEMKHCTEGQNTLKFFVNGKPSNQYGAYIFNDLDKILISYGQKSEDVSKQISSITSFSEAH